MKCSGNVSEIRKGELGVAGFGHRLGGVIIFLWKGSAPASELAFVSSLGLTLPLVKLEALFLLNWISKYSFSSLEKNSVFFFHFLMQKKFI